jgi:hypothetical protein
MVRGWSGPSYSWRGFDRPKVETAECESELRVTLNFFHNGANPVSVTVSVSVSCMMTMVLGKVHPGAGVKV